MSCFEYLRKGGIRELRAELDAEVELNVALLDDIESYKEEIEGLKAHKCAKVTINGVEIGESLSGINFRVSTEGAKKGERGVSGTVDTALPSSSTWDCSSLGHRFFATNINGEVIRVCMHCPAHGRSAA